MVGFALSDGQWNISVVGEVSADYVSRVQIGPGSLESSLNLFDATHTPGRRIGPSQPIRLGDSLWAITRDAGFLQQGSLTPARVQTQATAGGWQVYHVDVPDTVSPDDAIGLSRLLQRPIRHSQVRVWLESPWPIALREDGTVILPIVESGLSIKADRLIDVEIRGTDGEQVRTSDQVTALSWDEPRPGVWVVFVNEHRFMQFEIAEYDEPTAIAPAIGLILADGTVHSLFAAQAFIDRNDQVWSALEIARMIWTDDSLARLIRINGLPLQDALCTTNEFRLSTSELTAITAGNFGRLRWGPVEQARSPCVKPAYPKHVVRRAIWLLSVAGSVNQSSDETNQIPLRFALKASHPVIDRLKNTWWPRWMQPHLEQFRAELEAFK
jgi:hypothetical protein